jgi:polyvinyl alcohol dehydrogenase (cytochrome)
VDQDAVYVPDWAGNLFKLDATTGKPIWARQITEYTGVRASMSRVTPAVDGDNIFIGVQNGAHLLAISKVTGDLVWITQLDVHPAAVITQSPIVAFNRVYVGVSSTEEAYALDPKYPCCTFRGSVVSVDARTGAILWRAYTVPENDGQPGGYSGNAVWGSTPVVDVKRRALYITTGNNYTVPPPVKDCDAARRATPNPWSEPTCIEPDNHVDAIMALDLDTGQVKWSRKVQGDDAANFGCVFKRTNPNCPDPEGPDFDFGQGPMLFRVNIEGRPRELVGAGQKSGIFWALDPDSGTVVWNTVVGPGGLLGGLQWGSATDGKRIYVAIANLGHTSYTLVPSGKTVNGGSWSALDAATGKIVWQTADPESLTPHFDGRGGRVSGFFAIDTGPVTTANGVIYAGSMDLNGHMYALDAETGTILWSFKSGGSVNAGPAVVTGVVYWGSGYQKVGSANNKLYAFKLSR